MLQMRALLPLLTILVITTACDQPPGDLGNGPQRPTSFDIDLFGDVGHTFRFMISPDQAQAMEQQGSFEPIFGDEYTIGNGTYTDDLIVTDSADGETRAFGQVELRLIGQSSMRPWNRIPNLRIDMDELQPGLDLDGVEHLRLNNGQVGGIYREAIALRIWEALGYPVPRTSFAWVEAPAQWGHEARVPYTLIEVYKRSWCDHSLDGGCANMWEATGDLGSLVGNCQTSTCDDTRLRSLVDATSKTALGPGFTAGLAEWIDWEAYRSFQCLSWITGTGDDYVHNSNNIVLVERMDGKMQFLPYSVDISAGQEWYADVRLPGFALLSQGCQQDPECWSALLARCDELIASYEALDVVSTIVEPVIRMIASAGMERRHDDLRAQLLRDWYGGRAAELRADSIWTSTPCTSDAQCADREDGLTVCDWRYGVCGMPEPGGCREPCPDGFFCGPEGECVPSKF